MSEQRRRTARSEQGSPARTLIGGEGAGAGSAMMIQRLAARRSDQNGPVTVGLDPHDYAETAITNSTADGDGVVALTPVTIRTAAVPGLGFLYLEVPYNIDYPDSADVALLLPTGSVTPIIFPLRNGNGTATAPYRCTGGSQVLDFESITIVDAPGAPVNLSYFYPALASALDDS